jgi:hypothetical protein
MHTRPVDARATKLHERLHDGTREPTRVGQATMHLVKCLLGFPFTPVAWPVMFIICVMLSAPIIALGLGSRDEAIGLPRDWLRWRTVPRLLLTIVFVDLPVAFMIWLYLFFGFCFLVPAARVAFEMCRALLHPPCIKSRDLVTPTSNNPSSSSTAPRLSFDRVTEWNANSADDARYREHASIWAALEGDGKGVKSGDVRLLSLKWLMALADRGGVLSRRQDLPDEAFIDAARLRQIEQGARRAWDGQAVVEHAQALGQRQRQVGAALLALVTSFFRYKRNVDNLVPVVAVSYCWLEKSHPDREGKQLRLLCDRLRKLYGGRGLLGACQDYGFSDMGVFLDWGSGYQKDPTLWRDWMEDKETFGLSEKDLEKTAVDGEQMAAERHAYEASRTPEQKEAFHRMLLNTMDLWYAHAAVTVVLLTQLPDELPVGFDKSRTYSRRGWTTFERCSAELAKSFKLCAAKWKLVIDVADESGGAQRRLPTTPEQMEALIADCQFTNGADRKAVIKLYKKTAVNVLGSIKVLNYRSDPILCDDKWSSPEKLAEALNYCTSLKRMDLCGTLLDDEGATRLAVGLDNGALPALDFVDFGGCRIGARGIGELCSIFGRGVAPTLSGLSFSGNPSGDAGAAAVAAAFASGSMPPRVAVQLACIDMGDDGARALAAALPSAGPGCDVLCAFNRIGLVGQSALLRAVEAKHGPGIRHIITVAFNGFPWPAAWSRAVGRGLRRRAEGGWTM